MIAEAPVYDAAELKQHLVRFLVTTQKRSSVGLGGGRRGAERHHRTWPLRVSMGINGEQPEWSAALHDASAQGIGFLLDRRLRVGTTVYLNLFGFTDSPARVPAVIRHVTPHRHGYLVGCEYAMDTDDLCALIDDCVIDSAHR